MKISHGKKLPSYGVYKNENNKKKHKTNQKAIPMKRKTGKQP